MTRVDAVSLDARVKPIYELLDQTIFLFQDAGKSSLTEKLTSLCRIIFMVISRNNVNFRFPPEFDKIRF